MTATNSDIEKTSAINWRTSASLENVPRGDNDLAEVTSLERAVREWQTLDPQHQAAAVLAIEHGVEIDGEWKTSFIGEGIATLVRHLPAGPNR